MEVCIDSVESACNAEKGGAVRLELCSNLVEGGTTPSAGMLEVIKSRVSLPVFVMIRPRGGDFCYSDDEMEVMKRDIVSLKNAGADGFVFGLLTHDGQVDETKCAELLDLVSPLPATFHRAIDMSSDISYSLMKTIKLGFKRVLTSGGCQTALQGANAIREMIQQADNEIIVMPGGGITQENLEEILAVSQAKEFHGTARKTVDSVATYRNRELSMGSQPGVEYVRKVTSIEIVTDLVQKATLFWKQNHVK